MGMVKNGRRWTWWWVCAAGLAALSPLAVRAQPREIMARADVIGTREKIQCIVVSVPRGGTGLISHWHPTLEENKRHATFEMPAVRNEWREMVFSFLPTASGKVDLQLKGMCFRLDGVTQRLWVVFDDLTVEGAEVKNGDFENVGKNGGPANWHLSSKDGFKAVHIQDAARAHGGKGAIEVAHDQTATQGMQVEANRKVTVRVWQRLSADQ